MENDFSVLGSFIGIIGLVWLVWAIVGLFNPKRMPPFSPKARLSGSAVAFPIAIVCLAIGGALTPEDDPLADNELAQFIAEQRASESKNEEAATAVEPTNTVENMHPGGFPNFATKNLANELGISTYSAYELLDNNMAVRSCCALQNQWAEAQKAYYAALDSGADEQSAEQEMNLIIESTSQAYFERFGVDNAEHTQLFIAGSWDSTLPCQ